MIAYFENVTWGIAVIQNTPIIFFGLLAIHLLNIKTNRTLYISICVTILTTFTAQKTNKKGFPIKMESLFC